MRGGTAEDGCSGGLVVVDTIGIDLGAGTELFEGCAGGRGIGKAKRFEDGLALLWCSPSGVGFDEGVLESRLSPV